MEGRPALLPRALQHGSAVGVFSPSEPLYPSRTDRVRANAERIERLGHPVVYAPNAFNIRYHSAGTASERTADVHALVDDPRVGMLLGSWGGKTCVELLPHVDFSRIAMARKPIAGFSDVAVLLNAITASTGLITFHGPNVLGKLDESSHDDLAEFRAGSSFMAQDAVVLEDTSSGVALAPGTARGILFGGNLSTFTLGIAGTPFAQQMDNVLFFWESADERPQLLVQYLSALANSGFLDRVAGMIVGQTTYTDEGYDYQDIDEAILEATGRFGFPIMRIPTFGHSDIENPVVPIGGHCEMDADSLAARLLAPVLAPE